MMEIIVPLDYKPLETTTLNQLINLMKICGDADNENWKSKEYTNEIFISRIVYAIPSMLISGIIFYYLAN